MSHAHVHMRAHTLTHARTCKHMAYEEDIRVPALTPLSVVQDKGALASLTLYVLNAGISCSFPGKGTHLGNLSYSTAFCKLVGRFLAVASWFM